MKRITLAIVFLMLTLSGQGYAQDDIGAIRKAAEQGVAGAQNNLGWMYTNGRGVPQDDKEAVNWYRKAAEQGVAEAQYNLGKSYAQGEGVPQDYKEAVKWFRMAAEQGNAEGQHGLGMNYGSGRGVPQDDKEAVKWYRKAAEQNFPPAQTNLGKMYAQGEGVPQDYKEAVKWFRMAAEQGNAEGQHGLGLNYAIGQGVPQDYVQAHMWLNLAASQGDEATIKTRDIVANLMTPAQLAQAQELARNWKPTTQGAAKEDKQAAQPHAKIQSTGTGFFINGSGFAISNAHVAEGCSTIKAVFQDGTTADTSTVATDRQNDLALLKVNMQNKTHAQLRVGSPVRQGEQIVIYGYPLAGALATKGNLSTGSVSALSGLQDDTRFLQISAPVQQGNSGGPLLDQSGDVIGVVTSKLNAIATAKLTGDIPQNVNFAIKIGVATQFLDANGVKFDTATTKKPLDAADIGDMAKAFTFMLECYANKP
ncbi:MAG: SEL1-like repeat protein [Magnetococcales bacterium]|nr:SEL1-like repeat protein [Magnetococcales bacterium]